MKTAYIISLNERNYNNIIGIDSEHRLVYAVEGNEIIIAQCR